MLGLRPEMRGGAMQRHATWAAVPTTGDNAVAKERAVGRTKKQKRFSNNSLPLCPPIAARMPLGLGSPVDPGGGVFALLQ